MRREIADSDALVLYHHKGQKPTLVYPSVLNGPHRMYDPSRQR